MDCDWKRRQEIHCCSKYVNLKRDLLSSCCAFACSSDWRILLSVWMPVGYNYHQLRKLRHINAANGIPARCPGQQMNRSIRSLRSIGIYAPFGDNLFSSDQGSGYHCKCGPDSSHATREDKGCFGWISVSYNTKVCIQIIILFKNLKKYFMIICNRFTSMG